MKYKFREVKPIENDKFSIPNGIFRQTSGWAKLKKFFHNTCINGYDDQNNIVFSCSLLRFYIPFTLISVCYAPNGFVCDFKNTKLIKEFTTYFKKYMKQNSIAYALFDPEIIKMINFELSEEGQIIHKQMLSSGYIYEDKKAHQYMQINNNYQMVFDYDNKNIEDKTFNNFDKSLQYDINLCQTRGVTVEKYKGEEYIKDSNIFDIFYDLFIETSDRKGFGIKKKSFYQKMFNNLYKHSTIYLAKYNYDIDYKNIKRLITDVNSKIEELENSGSKHIEKRVKELNENIKSYEKRLDTIEKYKDQTIYIGAAYFISMGSKSYYLLGANSKQLKFTQSTSLLVWQMIKDSLKKRVSIFNLGGSLSHTTEKIEDDPMYSVYKFKKQLNGELVDYFGDYYLVNNSKIYNFLEKKHRLLKRLNSRF
ncbi:MAG: peptidoglycan bridge formation glycyltransferase FemA/FemB family protein [Bacilli bacterium]|nr:peptidoglycan bridge formation glycyltransferase FemA/FemB family protein [Bacilli bacterium]MDD4411605.1 peptidoglycan bridge formation glycyltransferase FemA/FemB family protein [Bacilli bacterium]